MNTSTFFDKKYIEIVKTEDRGTDIESQIKFLLNHLPEDKNISIIDQCCGYGRHLNQLYSNGFKNLTGVDINSDFIETAESGKKNNSIQYHCEHILSYKFPHQYDIILNLGSSIVSLSKEELKKLFKINSNLLKHQGKFILHNFNPFYANKFLPERTWLKTSSSDYIMEKRKIDMAQSFLQIFHVRMLKKEKGEYEKIETSIKLTLHSHQEIIALSKLFNLKLASVYGSFCGKEFDIDKSLDMIFVFVKN